MSASEATSSGGQVEVVDVLTEWFLGRIHVEWLTNHLHAGTRPDKPWEPNAGERAEAEAHADAVLLHLSAHGWTPTHNARGAQIVSRAEPPFEGDAQQRRGDDLDSVLPPSAVCDGAEALDTPSPTARSGGSDG